MTLYCGIDLHANNSVVAVLDEGDRLVYEKRLHNDLATIIGVLQDYQAELADCVADSCHSGIHKAVFLPEPRGFTAVQEILHAS